MFWKKYNITLYRYALRIKASTREYFQLNSLGPDYTIERNYVRKVNDDGYYKTKEGRSVYVPNEYIRRPWIFFDYHSSKEEIDILVLFYDDGNGLPFTKQEVKETLFKATKEFMETYKRGINRILLQIPETNNNETI